MWSCGTESCHSSACLSSSKQSTRKLPHVQMFQFVTNMAQAAYCRLYSPYPKQLSTLLFFYMITLLVLFLNFYLMKHGDAKKRPQPLPKQGHVKAS